MTQILSDLEQCWGVQKVVNFLKPLECIANSDPATQGTWNGILPPNHCMRLPSFVSFLFKPTCSYLTSPYRLSKSRAEFSEIELVENGPDRINSRTHGHDLPAPPTPTIPSNQADLNSCVPNSCRLSPWTYFSRNFCPWGNGNCDNIPTHVSPIPFSGVDGSRDS